MLAKRGKLSMKKGLDTVQTLDFRPGEVAFTAAEAGPGPRQPQGRFWFSRYGLKRNGGVAAANQHVCAAANANRSVSRCADIIADKGAGAAPQRGRCVNAPYEFRPVRNADVRPNPSQLGDITLMAAINAHENATRLLDGCDDSADLRRANAAQSTDADSRVSRRSTAQH